MYLNSDFPFSRTNSFNLVLSVMDRFDVFTQKPIKKLSLLMPVLSAFEALFISIPRSVFNFAKQYFSAAKRSPIPFNLLCSVMY